MGKQADILFADIWVFYKSTEDPGMWVAHSLKTDQIAMGDCLLQAYVAMKQVMRVFWKAYSEDNTIEISPAPQEIQDKLKTAKLLEKELLARADELLRRRRIPKPVGDVFKTMDVECMAQ